MICPDVNFLYRGVFCPPFVCTTQRSPLWKW